MSDAYLGEGPPPFPVESYQQALGRDELAWGSAVHIRRSRTYPQRGLLRGQSALAGTAYMQFQGAFELQAGASLSGNGMVVAPEPPEEHIDGRPRSQIAFFKW